MSRHATAYTAAATHSALGKGLCLMLAVLCTLLLCQQFQYWTRAAEPLVHMTHTITRPHLSALSAQQGLEHGRLRATDVVVQAAPTPSQPHWVF